MSSCAVERDEPETRSCIHTLMRLTTLALLACFLVSTATAQQQQTSSPQVTIVVVATGGEDRVTFAYNTAVSEQEAKERFQRLLQNGGWEGRLLRVRTESVRTAAGTQLPPITDVTGRARNVVDPNSGGLPVEPFLRTFSDLEYFELYFLVQGDMPFQGLRQWKTRDLHVQLVHTPGVYRYQVNILRHGADVDLRVPFHQPVESHQPAQERSKNVALGWRIAGWGLISLALGALAYLVMGWATRHSSRHSASAKRHESTREG